MVFACLLDWENEWYHMAPWGDIPAVFMFAGVLYYYKSNAEKAVAPEAEEALMPAAPASKDEKNLSLAMKLVGVAFSPPSLCAAGPGIRCRTR